MSDGAETIEAMATAALLAREGDRARLGEPAKRHIAGERSKFVSPIARLIGPDPAV